jgi:hypothetical protein
MIEFDIIFNFSVILNGIDCLYLSLLISDTEGVTDKGKRRFMFIKSEDKPFKV